MKKLINRIAELEAKQLEGTLTMCEEVTLIKLIDMAELFIYKN